VSTDRTAQVLTLLLAGGEGHRLRPLTEHRAKPAVPFGGSYRILDFTLSNCINSNFRRICVLTQYESLTLHRHLRSAWNILSPQLGEFIDILPPQQRLPNRWYLGTADAVFQNLHLLQQERPRWVLIVGGDHIYKMDYGRLLAAHLDNEASASVVCIDVPLEAAGSFGVAQADPTDRIVDFQEKPRRPSPMPGSPERALASMGVYLFDTEVLVRALIRDARTEGSSHDFGRDLLPRLIHECPVFAYRFNSPEQPGSPYWRDVGTIDSYWHANMDLLMPRPEFDLYDHSWPIHGSLGNGPPAKVCASADGVMGVVEQSLIAPGTTVSGGRVRRCVIGPRVTVHGGSELEECVLMAEVVIGTDVRLKRVIIEERARIPDGTTFGGDLGFDAEKFKVTEGGILTVPRRPPLKQPEVSLVK